MYLNWSLQYLTSNCQTQVSYLEWNIPFYQSTIVEYTYLEDKLKEYNHFNGEGIQTILGKTPLISKKRLQKVPPKMPLMISNIVVENNDATSDMKATKLVFEKEIVSL